MSGNGHCLVFIKLRLSFVPVRLVLLPVLSSSEHAAPAGIGHDGRTGTEIHILTGTFHDQQFFFTRRGKGFQHPAGNQGIDGQFRFGQFLRCDARDNQGMMVGHFRVVHASGVQAGKVKGAAVFLEIRHGRDFLQQVRDKRHDILRDMAAAGSRVGNQFLLVQRLRDG